MYKLMKIFQVIICIVLGVLNQFISKKNQILFYNGNEIYDNNEALFEHISENNIFNLVCYTIVPIDEEMKKPNVKYINKTHTLIKEYLKSKVIIESFSVRFKIKPCKNQEIIQLWHGTPLKRMGKNKKSFFLDKLEANSITKLIYPSEFFRNEYIRIFNCEESQLYLCGNPRNDLLFESINIESIIPNDYKLKVIWMPTFRKTKLLNLDNRVDSNTDIPILKEDNIITLNNYLSSQNICLIIKPHPLQNSLKYLASNMSNIKILENRDLKEKRIQLYHFVGQMDALITDYSSIYYDYLLLNRPIGFAIDDIDDYKDKRGFIVDNPLELMPGAKIYTMGDLEQFFNDLLEGSDIYKDDRKKICSLANYYEDKNNCLRITNLIKEKLKLEQK